MKLIRNKGASVYDAEPEAISQSQVFQYIATLINPVDRRLYDVVMNEELNSVWIVQPAPNSVYEEAGRVRELQKFGRGYFDPDDLYENGSDTYYRVHTPEGVVRDGVGLGLMLYSGLALAALKHGADGVFSVPGDRTEPGDAWWGSQVQRGLVAEASDTEFDVVSVDIEESEIKSRLADAGKQGVALDSYDPDQVDVEVEHSRAVQVLPAEEVVELGIVLALREGEVDLPPLDVVSYLDLSTITDPALLYNVLMALREGEASKAEMTRVLSTLPNVLRGKSVSDVLAVIEELEFEDFEELELDDKIKKNAPKPPRAWVDYFGDLTEPS